MEKETHKPVHTIRDGAIGVSIWQRQNKQGEAFYDFSISRAWKSDEKSGYANTFYTTNQDALVKSIAQAVDYIANLEQEPAATAA